MAFALLRKNTGFFEVKIFRIFSALFLVCAVTDAAFAESCSNTLKNLVVRLRAAETVEEVQGLALELGRIRDDDDSPHIVSALVTKFQDVVFNNKGLAMEQAIMTGLKAQEKFVIETFARSRDSKIRHLLSMIAMTRRIITRMEAEILIQMFRTRNIDGTRWYNNIAEKWVVFKAQHPTKSSRLDAYFQGVELPLATKIPMEIDLVGLNEAQSQRVRYFLAQTLTRLVRTSMSHADSDMQKAVNRFVDAFYAEINGAVTKEGFKEEPLYYVEEEQNQKDLGKLKELIQAGDLEAIQALMNESISADILHTTIDKLEISPIQLAYMTRHPEIAEYLETLYRRTALFEHAD